LLLALWSAYDWGQNSVIGSDGGSYDLQAAKEYLKRIKKLQQAVADNDKQKANTAILEIEQNETANTAVNVKKKEIIEQKPFIYEFKYDSAKTALQAIIAGQMYELSTQWKQNR
jgi:formaldehyde-activating enzyme involved in methanogenesis